MFEDSLLESGGRKSRLRRRGPWSTVFSFAFQCLLVALLLLIPLLKTQTLPKRQLMAYLVAPPPPPPPPPPAAKPLPKQAAVKPTPKPVINKAKLKAPTKIPKKIVIVKQKAPPPVTPPAGVVGGVVGGVPGGQAGGVVGGVLGSIMPAAPVAPPKPPPPPKPKPPERVKISAGVIAGMRLVTVQPVYPPLARQARISGTVVLQAVIGKDGKIKNLRAVSGNPMLIPSAIAAVSKWRYRPYMLDGEPVEVDTQVTVNFTLSGG